MMGWGGYSAIFSRLRATKMWEKTQHCILEQKSVHLVGGIFLIPLFGTVNQA